MADDVPDGEGRTYLLVRLSAIGDVLQCLHALADLRASRPRARIHWLVEERCAAVLRDHPHLDGVVVYRRRELAAALRRPWRWPRAAALVLRLVRDLRALRADAVVDLQGNLKGALLARLSGAPRRIGLAPGQGGRDRAHVFATETVVLPRPPVHRADRARTLLLPLGAVAGSGTAAVGGVDGAAPGVERWLAEHSVPAGGYAILHPGTSGFGGMKRWPPERFAALARRLRETRGLHVLVTAGPGEEPLADRVVAGAGGAAVRGPATATLGELGALLRRAALVVAADTGPAHLAAVLGAPTLCLFGPKDPAVYAPRGPRARVLWRQPWCSPCALRRCDDPVCMTGIETAEVERHVDALLAGAPR